MFKKMKEFVNRKVQEAAAKVQTARVAVKEAVANEDGNFFTENAVTIIIVVVIGVLVMAAITLLWNSTIIPSITTAIEDMFG